MNITFTQIGKELYELWKGFIQEESEYNSLVLKTKMLDILKNKYNNFTVNDLELTSRSKMNRIQLKRALK